MQTRAAMAMDPPDLSALATPQTIIAVRVTPRARRTGIEAGPPIRIAVSEPPEGGRATDAARLLLAGAMGVAPGRLTLFRGARSRDKLFRLD